MLYTTQHDETSSDDDDMPASTNQLGSSQFQINPTHAGSDFDSTTSIEQKKNRPSDQSEALLYKTRDDDEY